MHTLASRLLLYASGDPDSVLNTLARLSERVSLPPSAVPGAEEESAASDIFRTRPDYDWILTYRLTAKRILSLEETYRISGNLWQAYLAFHLATDDNPFTRACALGLGPSSLREVARHEAKVWFDLFHYDFSVLDKKAGAPFFASLMDEWDNGGRMGGNDAGDKLLILKERLAAAGDPDTFLELLADFIRQNGCGLSCLHKAFRVPQGPVFRLEPVDRTSSVTLDDLIGYEHQKKLMTDNMEAFMNGLPFNHMLLYGDAGTGKSTSVKALLNMYAPRGLRLIEVRKQQLEHLEAAIEHCRKRSNRYLICIDDLSFEENETGYKHLKAVIEGGVRDDPPNVMLVATSNRRHLVREDWKDRSDMEHSGDVHRSDTLEEKLSLAARFGCAVSFSVPNPKGYQEIVSALYKREGGQGMEEDALRRLASAWEIRHGGPSGRTARQFVNGLLARERKKEPD
ncbi:MAG: ATP-binding protein [Clostridia bacterium]|nr:ATP-binding protein [Clostridia bacterium]